MSFVITVYVPEAIVMAADSRQSIVLSRRMPEGAQQQTMETVNSDYVYKIYLLPEHRAGISTYGEFILGKVTIESHIKRFQEEKLKENDDVTTVAQKLLEYFAGQFPGANTTFHIAGFQKAKGISVPYIYVCQVSQRESRRLNVGAGSDEIIYGASWGGQADVIAGLLGARQVAAPDGIEAKRSIVAPVVWDTMPIQDAIDFAIYAVRTTIDTIRFQARTKNVGGPIDVLLLTPDKTTWIQRKEYRGQLA